MKWFIWSIVNLIIMFGLSILLPLNLTPSIAIITTYAIGNCLGYTEGLIRRDE